MNVDYRLYGDLSIDVELFEDSAGKSSSLHEVSEQGSSEKGVLKREFPNRVKAVRKDPNPSIATISSQCHSFVGQGTRMTPEERSFFVKYQQAKQICPSSLKCTTCLCKLFLSNPQNIQIHPVLGVLLCKDCREFYDNTPFTKDVKGQDDNCRWCAAARTVVRCHTCSNVFCKACLKRCLGQVPFAEVTSTECAWTCLVCNDLPLWAPRALARMVMTAIKSCSDQSPAAFNSNDPAIWLPEMIDEVEKVANCCKILTKKIRASWCTDNRSSERKSHQSPVLGKETKKVAVIGCCRQLREAMVATHVKMKSLEKKMLTKFKKTYGTTADIELHTKESSPKQDPNSEHRPFKNDPKLKIECYVVLNRIINKDIIFAQDQRKGDSDLKRTDDQLNIETIPEKQFALSSNLNLRCPDSDTSSTQDLNQKTRQNLLKDSSDSDTGLFSDLDVSLGELKVTSHVKGKCRSKHRPSKDDLKLKMECKVVLNGITNKDTETIPEKQFAIKRRSRIAEMWSSSSSSSDFEVEMNVEETSIPEFSTVHLIPTREDAVRQALLAPSDSDTDLLVCDTESEDSHPVLMESSQRIPFDHDNEAVKKKRKSANKIEVINLASDDEGTAKMPKIKTDKLLCMSLHDPDNTTKKSRKDQEMKKKIMKRVTEKREKQSSSDSETSESDLEKRKLKRIRLSPSVNDGNSDDGDDDESDNEKTTEFELPPQTEIECTSNAGNSSNSDIGNLNISQRSETSGSKGRKAIRRIMADTNLTDKAKAAAEEEEDRKRRILERQKFYDEAFVSSSALSDAQTNSLVLEFDPVTKKELVTVDKSIVTKLKLHQIQGVKFMWDACFESVERLKEHPGSGCILAHCMGLGKSLQVVTLVHTVITNKACQVDRVLVVCPVSTILNWVNEFKIWLGAKSGVDVYEITYSKQNKEASRIHTLNKWYKGGGVLIIGYAMYLHLVGENSKIVKSMEAGDLYTRSLVDPGPQLVVCDEGHFLKNEKTASYEALNKIATRRRIILTGTPLQNNLEEYFCMVQFVKPNLLGTITDFKNRFANPIKNGQAADSNDRDVGIMKRRAHVLHKMLEDFVQRFDYRVLTPFLSPKHEYAISVKLSELQIKMYQHYLEKHVKGGPIISNRVKGAGLFADFQELGRVWTHPKALLVAEINRYKSKMKNNSNLKATIMDMTYDHGEPSACKESDGLICSDVGSEKGSGTASLNQSYEEPSVGTPLPWWSPFCQEDMTKMELGGKLVLLMDILHQCELIGDKVLVFSQSLVSLGLIEEFLAIENERYKKDRTSRASSDEPANRWRINHDYFRLDGQTSSELRTSACNVFNNPSNFRARLFLISTKAGGIGINLIAANRVIIFDASWNPSHDVQSIFRVYRFGQRKPCYIYRFLAQGTMEEKIYDRQVTKLSLSGRVVDEQQIERHFNSADLKCLYSFEPDSHLRRPTPILPKDRLLAELIIQRKDWIVTYHEHDSLLENKSEEELTEVERKAAWDDFENEKLGVSVTMNSPGSGFATSVNEPTNPSGSLAALPNFNTGPNEFSGKGDLTVLP